jgi:hypothetical protein
MEIQGVKMLTLFGGLCYDGFINLVSFFADVWRQRLAHSVGLFGLFEWVPPEDGDRMQSLKSCVLK